MKRNEVTIKGSGNTIIQDTNNSKININSSKSKISKLDIAIIALALIGIIVAIIVGWDEILKFFRAL